MICYTHCVGSNQHHRQLVAGKMQKVLFHAVRHFWRMVTELFYVDQSTLDRWCGQYGTGCLYLLRITLAPVLGGVDLEIKEFWHSVLLQNKPMTTLFWSTVQRARRLCYRCSLCRVCPWLDYKSKVSNSTVFCSLLQRMRCLQASQHFLWRIYFDVIKSTISRSNIVDVVQSTVSQ